MDNELDLGKYSAAIRRRRWVIAAAVGLGAIVGFTAGWRAPLSSTRTLVPVDRSAELDSAGVLPENVDIGSILQQVAATLSSDSFDSELPPDSSVTAREVITEDSASILLEVSAPSESQFDRTLATAASAAASQYAAGLRRTIDRVTVSTQARIEAGRSALASIEQQLAIAGSDQPNLIERLLIGAEDIRATIGEDEGEVAALQGLSADVDGDLRPLDGADPARSRPPLILAVLGGAGAGLFACGIVVLVAAFDRRIRTRRDLERIGLTNLLGVLSKLETDTELDVLAGALRQAANRASTKMIQLVPVSASAAASRAEQLSRGDHPLEIHERPPITVDAVETMRHAPDSLNVIMITWGQDDTTASMSTANRLAAATSTPIGVVLVAVPATETEFVER